MLCTVVLFCGKVCVSINEVDCDHSRHILHQPALKVSSEKGASSWLSALSIAEHGFALHKGAFRDALCLRYGWCPSNLTTNCVSGKPFSVKHALNCACGGLPSIRYNEMRDITADLLTEVCHNVGTEPVLQSLPQEQLKHKLQTVKVEPVCCCRDLLGMRWTTCIFRCPGF